MQTADAGRKILRAAKRNPEDQTQGSGRKRQAGNC